MNPPVLKGWNAIGAYLGIGAAAAQRWAKNGVPVRREGRFTVADVNEIRQWLGREAHMPKPAYVLTADADVSGALKEGLWGRGRHLSPLPQDVCGTLGHWDSREATSSCSDTCSVRCPRS